MDKQRTVQHIYEIYFWQKYEIELSFMGQIKEIQPSIPMVHSNWTASIHTSDGYKVREERGHLHEMATTSVYRVDQGNDSLLCREDHYGDNNVVINIVEVFNKKLPHFVKPCLQTTTL